MDQVLRQFIIGILIPAPLIVFWLWMFRDMINNPYLVSYDRTTWTFMFVFLNFAAAAWYYLTEYKGRR